MPQARRLLATLSSIPSSSSSAASSSSSARSAFVPPYSHKSSASTGTTSSSSKPSLRAPYAHSVDPPTAPSKAFAAPYNFALPALSTPLALLGGKQRQTAAQVEAQEKWSTWARLVLASPEHAISAWEETLEHLASLNQTRTQVQGAGVPEVAAQEIVDFLKDEEKVRLIKEAGSVVVRNVLPDAMALGWAREVADEMRVSDGKATYWHPALLSARANPSLLSATSLVMSALSTYPGEEGFVLAEAVREGLGTAAIGTGQANLSDLNDNWAIDESSAPTSPMLAHLALTPSTTPLNVPSSIYAAIYSLLRPLFRPTRSRISFYTAEEYLASSNWSILSPSSVPLHPASAQPADSATSDSALPHLAPSMSTAVTLNPGDLILHHPKLPVQAPRQAFLPVTLIPNTSANASYIQEQQKAYEAGLPPPLATLSGEVDADGAVRVEKTVGRAGVEGWRGKKAMGY